MFKLERILTDDYRFEIFHELSTDCLFIKYKESSYEAGFGGLTQMLDPQTGKPLTYANWKEKYEKRDVNR